MVLGKFERDLITSPQTVTGSFVDIGDEIRTNQIEGFMAFIELNINDSLNVRIRALAKHASGATSEYVLPIKTISTNQVNLEDEFFEFAEDIDQNMAIELTTNWTIPFVQLQVSAGTVGASPATLDAVIIERSKKSQGGTF